MQTTNRSTYISNAARFIVERINADAITPADVTIDEIEKALDAPFFLNLRLSCQYDTAALSAGQRRALAKSIAGAVANHPDRLNPLAAHDPWPHLNTQETK